MKSGRLVSLMLLLQGRSPRSARELARSLEVSIRTIYRDVEALGQAGVPVYAERGSRGGIALSDGYRQAIAQFSSDELHALFAAGSDPLADLGVTGHESALHKLQGALPALQRAAAEKARQRILLDHTTWYRAAQPGSVLALLRRAVWDDRVLEIAYRDRGGAPSRREIEPLGLVSKAGVWYAVARQTDGELRTFRAERIVDATETGRTFVRPAQFDLERYWRANAAAMQPASPTYEATLRVRSDALGAILPYFSAEVLEDGGDWQSLRVQFPGEDSAVSHAMMLGTRAQILGPAAFREAVERRLRAMLGTLSAAESG